MGGRRPGLGNHVADRPSSPCCAAAVSMTSLLSPAPHPPCSGGRVRLSAGPACTGRHPKAEPGQSQAKLVKLLPWEPGSPSQDKSSGRDSDGQLPPQQGQASARGQRGEAQGRETAWTGWVSVDWPDADHLSVNPALVCSTHLVGILPPTPGLACISTRAAQV